MFHPSRNNGIMARAAVLARLEESLAHIAEQCHGKLDFDSAALDRLLSSLRRAESQKPALFSRYFELIEALQEGNGDEVERLLAVIGTMPARMERRPLIRVYDATDFSGEELQTIKRHISFESLEGAGLAAVSREEAAPRLDQVRKGLARIERDVPELSDELNETVAEFILGKGVFKEGGYSFDGASSLAYWGGVLLNTAIPKTNLEVVEMIAHEAAHNVLFGLSPTEFFVYNPETELHKSPLREDPRPLDGIYHASFVLCRMHYAVRRLREAGGLAASEREEAEAMLQRSDRNFRDGLRVLEEHADYTEPGRAIMAECVAYMDRAREPA